MYRSKIESAHATSRELMVAGELGQAARLLFDTHEEIVKSIRDAKDTDGPSLKKSSEEFEPSTDAEDLVERTMNEVRELVFAAITRLPESSVLFYSELGDYAKGTVKSYRDFVLITNARDEDDDNEQVVIDITEADIDQLRTAVVSFDNLAQDSNVPRKEKSGNIAFSSKARLFDDSDAPTIDASIQTFNTLFYVDGELVNSQVLSEVALYHLSSADRTVTTKDIRDVVAKSREDGKAILSENYTVTVNGHKLEMVRNES